MNSIDSLHAKSLVWLWAVAGIALLAPAAVAAPSPAASGPRPVIEIPVTSQDGGVVEEGTVVQFQFKVVNRGQADLEIKQVKPSCGCSVAQWDPRVKPGAGSVIQAKMNTEFFRGNVLKHLTVISNDPDRPQLDLTITARVTPLVKIEPGTQALLSVDDKPVTTEFTLERNGGQPMKVLQVIPNAPYLRTEVTPLPGTGRYKVTVTATKDTPLGRNIIPVVVRTDMPKAGMMTLVLTVDRGIVTVPPVLFYGLLPSEVKGPVLATLTISRSTPPFHVKSVKVDDPKLSLKLETIRDGAEYRVTGTYAGGWDPGLVRKTLIVTTDDPKQPTLEIPVQAVIQIKPPNAPLGTF